LPMYLFYSNIKKLLVIHWNCYVSSSCMRVKLSENPIQMTETTTHADGESVCTVTVQIKLCHSIQCAIHCQVICNSNCVKTVTKTRFLPHKKQFNKTD
jgi:hypothetical protein